MSKVLTLTRGKSQDGKTLFITDATTTYGTDLPDRDTLAVLPYFTYQATGQPISVVSPETYSPIDVVTFSVDVNEVDGVYYSLVFALPKWTAGPLDDGDIVYDTNTQLPSKMIEGVLTPITVASLVDEDVWYGEINSLMDTELVIKRDTAALHLFEKWKEAKDNRCEYQEYIEYKQNFDAIDLALWSAKIEFCATQYASAQKDIETGNDVADKLLKLDE